MFKKIKSLWNKAENWQGIITFMLVLFTANAVWKISISGDEGNNQVLLFTSIDIAAPFDFMVVHIASVVKTILTALGYEVHQHYANDICFANHNALLVVWGCSAIKQAFIFFCIMIFAQGPRKQKIWFVPLGILIVYLFNIFRIVVIAMIIKNNKELFYLFHEIIMKYLFYGVIFLYWLWWEEKFNRKKRLIINTKEA